MIAHTRKIQIAIFNFAMNKLITMDNQAVLIYLNHSWQIYWIITMIQLKSNCIVKMQMNLLISRALTKQYG